MNKNLSNHSADGALASQGISRRALLALSGVGVTSLALSACGGGSGGAFDTEKQLTFTSWGSGAEKDDVSKLVNEFAKQKGLTGNPQYIQYPNYDTKMNTLIAANTPPDAGYLNEAMAMTLASQGKIVNVLDYPQFQDFIPGTIHHVSDSRAVSQLCIETFAIWYDQGAMETAGIQAPTSADTTWAWDDYIQAADKLTVDSSGKHPSESGFNADAVKVYGTTAPYNLSALLGFFKSSGVDLFDEGGTQTSIASDGAVKVLQAINDMIFVHRVAPNAAQTTSIGAGASLQLASKKVAMAIDGQWVIPDLNIAQQKGTLKYNVAPLPKFGQDPYVPTQSAAAGVFEASNNKKIAVDLMLALADPENCALYKIGVWMPPIKKYYTDDAFVSKWISSDTHPSNYRTAVADMVMNHSVTFPAYKMKNFANIQSTITNALTAMFSKKQDVRSAAQTIADQIKPLLQGTWPDVLA